MPLNRSSQFASFLVLLPLVVCGCSNSDSAPEVAEQAAPAEQQETSVGRVEELVAKGKIAVPQLLSMLQSSSDEDQLVAAESLGKIGVPSDGVIEGLVGGLNDSNKSSRLRQTVASALGQIGPSSLPHLIEGLSGCDDADLASAIAKAIANLDLQADQAVQLILARQSIEQAKDRAYKPNGSAPAFDKTTTITRTNELGESRSRQVGPQGSANNVYEHMNRLTDDAAYSAAHSGPAISPKWNEALASLDSALAKIGVKDEAGRKSKIAEVDRAAMGFNPDAWQQLRVLEGGSAMTVAACFSSDGFLVASADSDGVVRIGRVHDGKLLHEFAVGEERSRSALAFSPRGDTLAIGSGKVLQLWDITAEVSRPLTIPTKPRESVSVEAVTFLEGGEIVVAACDNGIVHLWSVSNGELANSFQLMVDGWRRATFSSAGGYLLGDGQAFHITAAEAKPLACDAPVSSPAAISSNGGIVVSYHSDAFSKSLCIVDIAGGGNVLHTIDVSDDYHKGESVHCLALHPSEGLCIQGMGTGGIRFWSTEMGRPIHTFSASEKPIEVVEFSDDGTMLVTGGFGEPIRIWGTPIDASTSNRPPDFTFIGMEPANPWNGESVAIALDGTDPDGDVFRFEYRLDSEDVWHLGSDAGVRVEDIPAGKHSLEIRAVDLAGATSETKTSALHVDTWQSLIELEDNRPVFRAGVGSDARFSPDGKRIAVGDGKGGVSIWDVESGQLWQRLTRENPPNIMNFQGVAFRPDGKQLVGVSSEIFVWALPEGRLLKAPEKSPHLGRRSAIHYLERSDNILMGGSGLRLISVRSRQPVKTAFRDAVVSHMTLHPNRTTVAATFNNEPFLRTVNLETLEEIHSTSAALLATNLNCAAFSPSGDLVLTGSNEVQGATAGVRLWEADSLDLKHPLKGTPRLATCISFSPDGKLLAIGSGTGEIQIWDYERLVLRTTLRAGKEALRSVAFSPNGISLASTDVSSIVKLWNFSGTPATVPLASERTWTDNTGTHKIVATFVGFDGQKVTLKRSDGSRSQLPLSRLSEKDQLLIREYAQSQTDNPHEESP